MLALKNQMIKQFNQSFDQLIEERLDCKLEECSAELISGITTCMDEALNDAARVGLEGFIQSFEKESPKTVKIAEVEYRLNKISSNTFLTLFGPIKLKRGLYYPSKSSEEEQSLASHVPLDAAWGMSGRTVTPEVVEPVLFASTSMENKEISQLLGKLGCFSLSPSAIYKIRHDHGMAIHDWVQSEEGLQRKLEKLKCPEQTEALVVGLDGANLPLREPGPKRGRPQERPQAKDSGVKDQPKASCYKNAMVGSFSFYSSKDIIDITSGKSVRETVRLSSIYTAQMPQERFPDFKKEFESTLDHIESILPSEEVSKVLLLDGGKPLWGYLSDREERFKDYEKLLDYFHAAEHLSLAAEALFGKKDSAGSKWYSKWCSKLKNDHKGVESLVRSMQNYRRKTSLPKARLEVLNKQIGFFVRNRKWMNYASFVERDLPIGSGPTEAACKTIVKERMCRSGMRWDRQKGKSVLTLRAISKSDQWDQTWEHYYLNCWDKAA